MLSRKEAGAYLGISPDAVKRLWEAGELDAVKLPRMGGHGRNITLRFEVEELERFKKRNKGR